MRYIMLIYSQEDETATPEQLGVVAMAHRALMNETGERGILRSAEPLAPSVTATCLRMRDGKAIVTDGPYAETKEQLAGFYILDCENLDEALEWAAKIPTACQGASGLVEVRPLREMRQPDGQAALESVQKLAKEPWKEYAERCWVDSVGACTRAI